MHDSHFENATKMSSSDLIRALEAIEPETKAARVREILPVIERKLAAGVRLAVILKALNDAGLELSEATLRSYLYQHRKKLGKRSQQVPMARSGQARCDRDEEARKAIDGPESSDESRGPVPSSAVAMSGSNATAAAVHTSPPTPEELTRLMQPDPERQEAEYDELQRLGKEMVRNSRRKSNR
ncbi:conjugal transfer protein TraD [Variovorax sp. YR216]|uniref:conjugal transfer protein TraD n=1 Tax=Variovorax sp. YR216 TaxID=1882828 RepID=UPI000896D887|nr:conjugal transfer protein TraD [Variovorax sp. YR216]SEB25414.1 hypothetical protein SAMN05444680_12524 [Variovorax sp. YR216]